MGPAIAKDPLEMEWEPSWRDVSETTPFDAMLPSSDQGDAHLHSINEILGYGIHVMGHELGCVLDFVVDDTTWVIRQVLAHTLDNPVPQHFIIPPECIHAINWEAAAVEIAAPPDLVEETPRATRPVFSSRYHLSPGPVVSAGGCESSSG